jgi:hypothetical protein
MPKMNLLNSTKQGEPSYQPKVSFSDHFKARSVLFTKPIDYTKTGQFSFNDYFVSELANTQPKLLTPSHVAGR